MTPRFIAPALVAIGILVASAVAYAQVGGGSHRPLVGSVLDATETTTATATATATNTPLAGETETATPTATPTATATPAGGEEDNEDNEDNEDDNGNHEDGILGIPSDDSPACMHPGADGQPRGCIIMTTPSGVKVRVPNSPGHQKDQDQEQNESNSPGHGQGRGQGAGGNGEDSGAED